MKVSEERQKQMVKYARENLKRIPLDVPIKDGPESYSQIKTHAEKMGESVNGFIKRAIRETMARDRSEEAPPQGE